MTDIVQLLTTFHGRISRKQWWIGFVITLIASIFGTLLFNPEMFTSEEMPPPSWPDTVWQLVWLVPGTAITVKRFNDRDWPWWLGYAFAAVRCVRLRRAPFRVADRSDCRRRWRHGVLGLGRRSSYSRSSTTDLSAAPLAPTAMVPIPWQEPRQTV